MPRVRQSVGRHEALAEGKGVILLSAHFSTLEISGAMIALFQPFQVIYKKARNPLFEAIVRSSRERKFLNAIDTYDVRRIAKTLKEGLVTWYAMDVELVEAPEDWTGPVDMEDLGSVDAEMSNEDWQAPYDEEMEKMHAMSKKFEVPFEDEY